MSDQHDEPTDLDKCEEIIGNAKEYLDLPNEVKDEKLERATLAFRDLAVSIKQQMTEEP